MTWCCIKWYDMIWCCKIWYDVVWYDMMLYDMIWCCMIWHDVVLFKMMDDKREQDITKESVTQGKTGQEEVGDDKTRQ